MTTIPPRRCLSLGTLPYYQRVLHTRPANLIAYWPLWEKAGTVVREITTRANNGAYTGVDLGVIGIGDGQTAPYFDGTNDYANILTAGLNTLFVPPEFTALQWWRVANANVWTDATERDPFTLWVDANNNFTMWRSATNYRIGVDYTAGATSRAAGLTGGPAYTNWFCVGATVSVASGVSLYVNGVLKVANTGALGAWSGGALTRAVIGAKSISPSQPWFGNLTHCALWNVPLTAGEIRRLARVR